MKDNIIYQALAFMLRDPDVSINEIRGSKISQIQIISYALDFSKMFAKNEVGNLIEYFEKIHYKRIEQPWYLNDANFDRKLLAKYFTYIESFIDSYTHPSTDQKLKFPEKKVILLDTLSYLEEAYSDLENGMFANINYDQTVFQRIKNNNLKSISIIKKRVEKSGTSSTLFQYIQKSNMNYILNTDINGGTRFYPFIFDLLLYSFLLDTKIEMRSEYMDNQKILETVTNIRKDSHMKPNDKKYIKIEFLKLSELFSQIQPKYMHHFLLYHYCQILGCEYDSLKSLYKQFMFEVTNHHRKKYEYKDFSHIDIVADLDFRHLSLAIPK